MTDGCCGYGELAEARACGRLPELVEEGRELRPEALLEAHHRFHEGVACAADGQHSNEAVPVDQVVVDAPLDQAEHVAEHGFVLFDDMRGDAEDLAELDIDLAVGAAGEVEGQGGGDPFVAFDDVGVVPEGVVGTDYVLVVEGFGGKGSDRAGLQNEEPVAAVEGPLAVLGRAHQLLQAPGLFGDFGDLLIGKGGAGMLLRWDWRQPDATLLVLAEGFGLGCDFGFDGARVAVDGEMVGLERAADQALAEAVNGFDDDVVAVERRSRIAREGDAGRCGVDHALDDDGDTDVAGCESLLEAVGDRSRGES